MAYKVYAYKVECRHTSTSITQQTAFELLRAKYTSKDAVSEQGCAFSGSQNQNLTFIPLFSQKPSHLGPNFDEIFARKQL